MLGEVARLFLTLGVIGFGGPAAHIALMREEIVRKRRWVSDQQFLDLLGATNLIPGPNSTEMAIHLGFVRAGWPGLIVGGACFIAPAMLIVMALAALYVAYGTRPEAQALLFGVKPVIIAVVVQALWALARTALKTPMLAVGGVLIVAFALLGVNEIALLFLGGGALASLAASRPRTGAAAAGLMIVAAPSVALAAPASVSLAVLFAVFFKIGAVLYGSGYVLLAFLRADFVQRLGWLTDQQLLDAISIGQVTPGPVLTTATFIGYVLGGWPAAVLATLAIFLPAFVFVAVSGPIIPRLREWRWTAALLDGVNVAALGLMAAVTWELARAALVVDPLQRFGTPGVVLACALALAAGVVLLRLRVNSAWLVAGGAVIGVAASYLLRA